MERVDVTFVEKVSPKVNNRNIRKRYKISSDIVLVSSLLTSNTFNTFSQRFYYCFKQVNVFWEKKSNLVRIAKR